MKLALMVLGFVLLTSPVFAQQPQEKEFNFKLTVNDINVIGKALGSQPYNEVTGTINKMSQQFQAQQQPVKVESCNTAATGMHCENGKLVPDEPKVETPK